MRSFKVAGKKNSEGEKKAFLLKGMFLEWKKLYSFKSQFHKKPCPTGDFRGILNVQVNVKEHTLETHDFSRKIKSVIKPPRDQVEHN